MSPDATETVLDWLVRSVGLVLPKLLELVEVAEKHQIGTLLDHFDAVGDSV
jgi:hypothetical protein